MSTLPCRCVVIRPSCIEFAVLVLSTLSVVHTNSIDARDGPVRRLTRHHAPPPPPPPPPPTFTLTKAACGTPFWHPATLPNGPLAT